MTRATSLTRNFDVAAAARGIIVTSCALALIVAERFVPLF
jgi:hypothetical protein